VGVTEREENGLAASPGRERSAYRLPEIEYMRALAVALVIVHHLGFVPGGFIGVDIFFVISGFVISQALDESRHVGVVSRLKHFYYRRIIRIIPPLLVVTLVSLLFGWLLFFDADLARVQRSVAAQAIFLQNAFFIDTYEDYFRILPSTKVTLHTWSLAVEEQFYVFFPLFFMAVAAVAAGRRWGFAVGLLGTTAALLYFAIVDDAGMRAGTSVMLRPFIANAIDVSGMRFYALPFRAWELLLGCCVFLVTGSAPAASSPSRRARTRAAYVAVLFLLAGAAFRAFLVESWPNVETVGVCVLAAVGLAFAAALRGAPERPSLAGRCVAYLGNTSYSSYLWHWPLLGYFSYTNHDFGRIASDYLLYFGVLALLVALTYHTIEKFRFRITPAYSVVLLLAFVGGLSWLARIERDPPGPGPRQTVFATAPVDVSSCQHYAVKDVKRPFVVLFGESHAQMIRTMFTEVAARYGLDVVCLDGSRARLSSQREIAEAELKEARDSQYYAGTFMAMRWNAYAVPPPSYSIDAGDDRFLAWEGRRPKDPAEALLFFNRNIEALMSIVARPDRPGQVAVLLQVPEMSFEPPVETLVDLYGLRLRPLGWKPLELYRAENAAVRKVFSRIPGVGLVDPEPILCGSTDCPYREGWNVLYKDYNHVSVYGARKAAPLLDAWLGTLRLPSVVSTE
jgi:peptidoglycan/LPS O-acetylase OafA/YrhL